MKQLRRHNIEILIVTEHSAEKVFLTPDWFKTATAKNSEELVEKMAAKIRCMEKQDEEMEKTHKKRGTSLPADAQLLSFVNS